jgi:tetratricopeptide (TPR) repeat protein
LYARAIWACPEDISVWALHASALAEQKDYSEGALIVYEKVCHNLDCGESILVALGHTYIGIHAEKDSIHRLNALIVWEHLYQKGKDWPELITALASAYMEDGRVNDTAVSLWEKHAAINPRNGMLRLRLAQEFRMRGNLQSAVRYYKEAAKLLPKDFDAQFETASVLKNSYADYTSAVKLLQKAIKLPKGQKHLDAHFSLAEALLVINKRDEAKRLFQTIAEEIDPGHTPTLLHLARLNLKYEEEGVRLAEALYTQALTVSPNSAETYRGMADLYREKGQAEHEEQALEKYLMLSEPDAKRYRQLADLYIRKGDFIRAEGALRQVIALGEGDKQLYTLLGEVILQGSIRAAA